MQQTRFRDALMNIDELIKLGTQQGNVFCSLLKFANFNMIFNLVTIKLLNYEILMLRNWNSNVIKQKETIRQGIFGIDFYKKRITQKSRQRLVLNYCRK